jgi:putative ABC transport system permease protein
MTLWLVSIRLALGSLNRARLRSALTTLGILIGIASVVVVVAIGRGAREQVGDSIGSLGSNVIYVFSRPVAKSGARGDASAMGVSVDDAAAIGREAGISVFKVVVTLVFRKKWTVDNSACGGNTFESVSV